MQKKLGRIRSNLNLEVICDVKKVKIANSLKIFLAIFFGKKRNSPINFVNIQYILAAGRRTVFVFQEKRYLDKLSAKTFFANVTLYETFPSFFID